MAKDKFLAVAFTDVNGNDKYQAGKDALIAAIVDTDQSNTVTVGDTVTLGTIPDLDGSQLGTYTHADSTITSVLEANLGVVHVGVADGFLQWRASSGFETFFTAQDAASTLVESQFTDDIDHTAAKVDVVRIDASVDGPGDPDTGSLDHRIERVGDDGFLDVLIA